MNVLRAKAEATAVIATAGFLVVAVCVILLPGCAVDDRPPCAEVRVTGDQSPVTTSSGRVLYPVLITETTYGEPTWIRLEDGTVIQSLPFSNGQATVFLPATQVVLGGPWTSEQCWATITISP